MKNGTGAEQTSACILVVLCCIGFLQSCGGTYGAERRFWHAGRLHAGVLEDPGTATPEAFGEAVCDLETIVDRYPAWDRAPEIQVLIARMHAARRDFAAAAEEALEVPVRFPEHRAECAQALADAASFCEVQGDTERAAGLYRRASERYPLTPAGLDAPLRLIRCYGRAGMSEDRGKASAAAARRYRELIALNPYGQQVPVVQRRLVALYGDDERWPEAARSLEECAGSHPDSENAPGSLLQAGDIRLHKLGDTAGALADYRAAADRYPRSPHGKKAALRIAELAVAAGDMPKAESLLAGLLESYGDDASFCCSARRALAAGYEKSGRFDAALEEYRTILSSYAVTVESMGVPLLLARCRARESGEDASREALAEAVEGYRTLLKKAADDATAAAAQDHLAGAFVLLEWWNDAVDAYAVLARRYRGDPRADTALLSMGMIYQEKLNDGRKAAELYAAFLRTRPDPAAAGLARERLRALTAHEGGS